MFSCSKKAEYSAAEVIISILQDYRVGALYSLCHCLIKTLAPLPGENIRMSVHSFLSAFFHPICFNGKVHFTELHKLD